MYMGLAVSLPWVKQKANFVDRTTVRGRLSLCMKEENVPTPACSMEVSANYLQSALSSPFL